MHSKVSLYYSVAFIGLFVGLCGVIKDAYAWFSETGDVGSSAASVDGTCGIGGRNSERHAACGATFVRMAERHLCEDSARNGWVWSCMGRDGGASAACSAPPAAAVNGQCGTGCRCSGYINTNQRFVRDRQCFACVIVRGNSIWTWRCSGSKGGNAVQCTTGIVPTPRLTPTPAATNFFTVTSPAANASVTGTVTITGTAGSQWMDVALIARTRSLHKRRRNPGAGRHIA